MFLVPVSRSVLGFDRFVDQALDHFFADGATRNGTATAQGSSSSAATTPAARTPALDVAETDTTYTVQLDMPGLTREDIKVQIEERRVTVSGRAASDAETREGERLVWRERHALSYSRSFVLASDIDQEQSGAKYENGVLTLTLAKRRPATSQLTIN
jgi:HSP20 family protein